MDQINLIRLAFLGATIMITVLLIGALFSIQKGNRKANLFLIILIFTYSSCSLSSFLMFSGVYKNVPDLVLIFYPLAYISGSFFYFYIKLLLNKDLKFKWYYVLNFIPALYGLFRIRAFFSFEFSRKIKFLTKAWFGGAEISLMEFMLYSIPNTITVIYLVVCYFLISKTALKQKVNSSNTAIEYLEWLKKFTSFYFILIVVDMIRLALTTALGWDAGKGEVITTLLISLLIQYYIFQIIKNPELVFYKFSMTTQLDTIENIEGLMEEKQDKNSSVSSDLSEKIVLFMKKEKPYLNPELKLHELALMLDLTPHHLSKIIRQEFKVNFYNFINRYRVNEFKEEVLKNENKNLTLSGVAKNTGFNSKSSFNRIFKLMTDSTPREYLKQQTNHQSV